MTSRKSTKRNHHTARDRPIDRGPRTYNLEKLCSTSKKRKYTSAGAARRGGQERYGNAANAYRCAACGSWHVTRAGVPALDPTIEQETDSQLDAIVDAALSSGVDE